MPVLLRARTGEWSLELVGNAPNLPKYLKPQETTVAITGSAEVQIFDSDSGLRTLGEPTEVAGPFLFENTSYQLYVTGSAETDVDLPPGAVVTSYRVVQESAITQHFELNFRNDVGQFDIAVTDGNSDVSLGLEVFPSKLDYRSDYVAIRDDVSTILRSLVIAAQARTYGLSREVPTARPTLVEWLALLRTHSDELIRTFEAIMSDPKLRIVPRRVNTPVTRARHIDQRQLERLLRRPPPRVGGLVPGTRIPLPHLVPERTQRLTADTPENRYLKALIVVTLRRLRQIEGVSTTGDEDADLDAEQKFFAAARPFAATTRRTLTRILAAPFWQEVRDATPVTPSSEVMLRHPLYARAERLARILNGGLSVETGLVRIGLKNIALLYEYWCFLHLLDLLRDSLEIEQESFVRIRHLSTVVTLQKGMQAAVRFRHIDSGASLLLVYNRMFQTLPTTNQQPDNVIQLASTDRLAIFDAKYRLSFDPEYVARHGGIGPREEDINTMHRYRDAIVIPATHEFDQPQRVVTSALVLFPSSDEDLYRDHRFFRSIGAVNVGALPFLPGRDQLVGAELTRLVNEAVASYAKP